MTSWTQAYSKYSLFLLSALLVTACKTTKVEEKPKMVDITPPVQETCIPIERLTKVVIPAVTKSGYSIVSIEGRTEQYYDEETKTWKTITTPPIERKEPYTKIIEPEKIIYVDSENKEVTDICQKPVPPAPTTQTTQTSPQRVQKGGNVIPAETTPVEEEDLPPVQ